MKERRFSPELHRPEAARGEMRRELEFHIEERIARLIAKGMRPDEARAEAVRRLGAALDDATITLGKSAASKERKLRMRDWISDLKGDIRYAIRGLARQPVFTAVAIGTLALAIGGNTAMYSAIDALILRSLPFEQPGRLMDISIATDGGHSQWSWPKARAYHDVQQSFSAIATYSSNAATLAGDNPERVNLETVSADYLRVLGVRVAVGTDFAPAVDAGPGVGAFALIGDGLWRRHFASATDVVGKRVVLDNTSYEVLGVLPQRFTGVSGNADVLVNATSRPAADLMGPWNMEYAMVGRLKSGVTPDQAAAETHRAGVSVARAFPTPAGSLTTSKTFEWGADARPFDSIRIASGLRTSLYVLFAAVGMVLLIACANLANLLLARSASRRREIAVRLAIGASRGRLLRLLVTESLVLSFAGGAAGLLLAYWAARGLAALNPAESLRAQALSGGVGAVAFSGIRLDASALLFTLAVTVIAGLLFGLVPAIGATRGDLNEALKDDGAASAGPRRRRLDRRALVIAEVALAIVLLAGSGLMLRSLVNLMRVDPGFRADNVLTLKLEVPQGSVARDSMPGFYETVRDRLSAIPGVSGVALSDCAPLAGGCNGTIMTFPDQPRTATNNFMVGVHWVSPNWFSTMGVPLLRGRMFDASDRRGGEKVVVINDAAVKKYFAGADPIGRRVAVYQGGFNTGAVVIGVVGDVRFGTIGQAPRPDAYISYGQSGKERAVVFLRTADDPATVVAAARAAMHEVAPFTPVFDVQLMKQRVSAATSQARLSAGLLIAFAAMALALAAMGTYGVMAFAVTQRTREVGIRMALGADRGRVLRLFTVEGLTLAGIGTVLGLAGAIAATRLLRTMLFGVTPGDPLTFVGIAVVAILATLLASWVPARRAAALDPVKALK
ncbi:MAG TPA: ABC transporter permease [Gemmatimonadales bacterium]